MLYISPLGCTGGEGRIMGLDPSVEGHIVWKGKGDPSPNF